MTPHQDGTFLRNEPLKLFGFWFPIDDATVENGCLWFAPGSHKLPISRHFERNQVKVPLTCWALNHGEVNQRFSARFKIKQNVGYLIVKVATLAPLWLNSNKNATKPVCLPLLLTGSVWRDSSWYPGRVKAFDDLQRSRSSHSRWPVGCSTR